MSATTDPGGAGALPRMGDASFRILRGIVDGCYLLDREHRFRYIDEGALNYFRMRADELLGRSVWEAFPVTRGTALEDAVHRAGRGELVEFETRSNLTGAWIKAFIVSTDEGIWVFFKDDSQRKREQDQRLAALERERKEREAADILNQISQTILVEHDLHKLVQYVTDIATRQSGAQFGAFFYNVVDDRRGAYMLYTISGVDPAAFSKFPMPRNTDVFAPTFVGEGVVRSDNILKDPRYGHNAPHYGMPKGHLPVVSYLAVPVMSRSGEVLGGMFFGHPEEGRFTEYHERVVVGIAAQASIGIDNARLYAAVSESEERFRLLANTIPQLAWMARPDGEIFWYNQRWYDYTGTTPQQMKDDGWATVLDPAELPRVLERFKASIESGMPWDDTFPIRARDGQFRWHLSRALPLRDKNGEIQIWFGTNTDVTEQRRLAEERKELLEGERAARTEAERASRLKDDFLATLSHELRTPLNAILGWSQLLEQGGGGTAEVQEGLSAIARNARIQTQLIEDLLDMSRILTGKFRLDVRPLRLEEVIDKAIESVMPAALAKEIRIEKILDTAAGPMLGDAARLQQAVWNLVSNSVKFTPRSGRVQVILRRVSSHVEIVVSDTGAGIAAEFLPYVFDRFRQADASTTRRTGGLGLGLAIVKQIAELHGGSVSATSRGANAGSTFAICLPVSLAQPRDAVDPDADAADLDRSEYRPKLDGLTVLVVDDEPDARQLARRILEEYGAKVQTAASANEALTSLLQRRPDVMISDIGMPEMDGYELMRRVRGLPADQGGQVPAAALTAFARSEDRRRALMAGYQSHVVKPVDTLELATVVASLAGRTARQR